MSQQGLFAGVLDPSEAPPGYYAVLKSEVASDALGNICRACDWRSECNGFEHRCMSYQVVTGDGRELKRVDGCSVVFKRVPPLAQGPEERKQ